MRTLSDRNLPINKEVYNGHRGFDYAINQLKLGNKVARKGWNGNKKAPRVSDYPLHIPTERLEIKGDYAYLLGSKGNVAVFDSCLVDKLNGLTKFTESKYFTTTDNSKSPSVNTALHTLLFDCPEGLFIDHINGNILDNREENIRFVTSAQNSQNRKSSKLFKGTTFDDTRAKPYIASIQIDGKTKHLGRFDNEEDAARAYDKRAWKEWGEFAKLNFPDENHEPRMFIFLVPGSNFKVNRAPLLGIYEEGTEINYQPHIDMKTADDTIVPWLCSQSDMLAEDYYIIN